MKKFINSINTLFASFVRSIRENPAAAAFAFVVAFMFASPEAHATYSSVDDVTSAVSALGATTIGVFLTMCGLGVGILTVGLYKRASKAGARLG